MVRTGAALRRMFAWAGLSLAGLVGAAPAQAQTYGAPLLLAEPLVAHPINFQYSPMPVAPAGYYAQHVALDDAAGGPGAPVAAPCNACGAGDACGSCGGCGACDACGACGSRQPCYAGPRCRDPWYVSFSGGWAHRETVHEVGDPSTFIELSDGFAANGALGYRFNMFRVEAEFSFMNTEIERAGSGGLASVSTGNCNLRALMFNVYHDIDLPFTLWRPYLGAGLGLYQSDLNSLYPEFFADPNAPPGFSTTPINSTSDMPFAYQFRAGASLPLGERTEFFSGYRYFKGEELTFASAPFAGPAAPTFHPDGAKVHSIEFGLRVRF